MLSKDFKEFVALLKEHDAEYMIVGGYAVGVHGYPLNGRSRNLAEPHS